MEKVAQAFARNNPTAATTVSTVRYGNVMMSRGSVIPLFVEQARAGRPMTVTDPDMTRFLMSLDEAVLLVEHAFDRARPGDLFIRKAPACTVEVLAHAVSRLLGVEPQVEVIGTRHGEKLYETLATREELARSEDQGDYFRVAVDARDLNYGEYFDEGSVAESHADDYHSHNTERLDVDAGRRADRLDGPVAAPGRDVMAAARTQGRPGPPLLRPGHPAVREHPGRRSQQHWSATDTRSPC